MMEVQWIIHVSARFNTCAFDGIITLIVNQQMHLHKITQ